ncbi:energy-coupling factor transporter ATPase [Paenibacillus sp. M1]|uniref:Energy-coupling factor transporter ATPase n=1 Tax=Paenibacillus haidiansis TaxID=1574488 RepID=A0ABU7VR02_9BACL
MRDKRPSSGNIASGNSGVPAIFLQDVIYAYEPDARPAVEGISLVIGAGEWVTIAGPSGSGKSTLAGLLSGYLPRAGGGVREGRLTVHGLDPASAGIAELAKAIGTVFQDPDAQLVRGRVEDEAAFGPENLCLPAETVERRVAAALQDVDLLERRRDSVHELSGGGRQRAAIASVLALAPRVLVLDEAAASLDAGGRRRLAALLRGLHQSGVTLVTVTGRLDELALAAPRLVVLAEGRIAADGPAPELLRERRPLLSGLGLLPALPRSSRSAVLTGAPSPEPAEPTPPPLLDIRGLSFAYGAPKPRRRPRRNRTPEPTGSPVLQDVHMRVRAGEWHMLCGDNGSGKTTISRLVLGLETPPPGTVFWRGRDASELSLYELAADIGYVFQHPEQQFVAATVLDELLFGPRSALRLRPKDKTPEPLLRQAQEWLGLIGLEGREQESPYLLSGGEKRLLSAAAGLAAGRKLILLDEPTAGTDYAGASVLAGLCRKAVAAGTALIMITHEPEYFAGEDTIVWNLSGGVLRAKS